MPKIQIGQDIINFPSNGSDALWSPAVIQFAQIVANTLSGTAVNIPPKVQTLSNDLNTNADLIGATFDGGAYRKFSLSYVIYRERLDGSFSISESGTLTGSFNELSNSWELQDEYIGDRQANGTSWHSFTISGDQIQFSTPAIGAPYDNVNSKISFSAQRELASV